MSHELRTPLNAVIGFAEIMHQQVLGPITTPEYRDMPAHILRKRPASAGADQRRARLRAIESGSLRLNLAAVEVHGLLGGTLELLAAAAAAGGVTLATDLRKQRIVIRATSSGYGKCVERGGQRGKVHAGGRPGGGGTGARR